MRFSPILALVAALSAAPLASAGTPKIGVASSVDDTYGITQGPTRGQSYVGMPELFSAIRGSSHSPDPGTFETYKTSADLDSILKRHSEQKFILFGSDTGQDSALMAAAAMDHPGQIVAQYVHRVSGKVRRATGEQVPFYASLDVALGEYNAGRISEGDVIQVILTIESDDDLSADFVPDYARCWPDPDWLDDLTDDASGRMSRATLDRIQAIWDRAQHFAGVRTDRYINEFWLKDIGDGACTN